MKINLRKLICKFIFFHYDRVFQKKDITKKVESAQETLKQKFEDITNFKITTSNDSKADAYEEIIRQFKQKFNAKDTSR